MSASSKKTKIIAAILASITGVTGVSSIAISSIVMAYDAVFPRYERPDYDLVPGQVCIERVPELKRREIWIKSGDNALKAHVYDAEKCKGLIVFAHGIHSGADDYLPIIKYLVENGYSVIAHNVTGTFESEGDSTIGMCQSLVDMDRVVAYVQSSPEFMNIPLFTMGHSWGGYAATSVLALRDDINACAAFAPMADGSTMMAEKGKEYAGEISQIAVPAINAYQNIIFGKYTEVNAIDGINAHDIPVLIAQGVDDKVITYDRQSVLAHKKEITNPNVVYYIGKGLRGSHNGIMHSERANAYQLEVQSELKLLEIEKGEKLSDAEKAGYYKSVNHAVYSEVNFELLDQIIELFDKTLM